MVFKYICPKCGYENIRKYPAVRIVCDKCLCVFRPSEGVPSTPTMNRVPLPIEGKVNMKPTHFTISKVERRLLNRGPGC